LPSRKNRGMVMNVLMEPHYSVELEALVASLLQKSNTRTRKPLRLDVSGVTEAARSYLVSGTSSIQRGPVLVVTSDNEHAAIWAGELRFWLDHFSRQKKSSDKQSAKDAVAENVPAVHVYDELPESEQLSQIPSLRRYHNLGILSRLSQNLPGFFIVPVRSFTERLPQLERFKEMTLRLQVGDTRGQSKILHQLEEMGYEPESAALTPGTFARRGDLVEFFSPDNESPTRLEFLGGTLDKISMFDIATKKATETVTVVRAIPLKLLMSQGRLVRYIGDPAQWTSIIDDPDDLKTSIDPLGQKNETEWRTLIKATDPGQRITFRAFLEEKTADTHIFNFTVPPLFRGHLPSLREEIKQFHKKKFRVLILTGDPEKIRASLDASAKHAELIEVTGTLRQNLAGFRDTAGKLTVLTDREIFGPEAVQPPKMHRVKRFDQAFVADLEPGHYVVHVDHGIGRFLGMVRNLLQGVEKEYFVLQYAEGDRLYVPVEAAEKLSRYIGAANPVIHRLSETSWIQIKAQLKESTEKLAKELLKLYAERQVRQGVQFKPESEMEKEFARTFPYDETPDQLRAWHEIQLDTQRPQPMDRLLVGDVGFGKTEVAMRAAFKAAANGRQCAVLAPTTILADQHYKNFSKRFAKFPFTVDVLSRFRSAKEQRETIAKLRAGTVDVVIGTHRLFSKDIEFKNLGLVVIDEEQRFGVEHKEKLKKIRSNVHVLSLSATPIPRTLQFSLSGIRDISTIETPPPGRYPIETKVAVYDDREIKSAIELELKRGGQVYVLHNRIETIKGFAEKIASLVPKARVRIGHGQLHETELAQVMDDFYQRKYDVLVASTIIENGLDIPTVNTIIVDQATHFGLAQLYQLRGRIGRGNQRAFAYLFYNRQDLKGPARSRLLALLEATELGSGFQIALRDLELRGAGNLLGGEQSGEIRSVGLNMYLRLLHRAVQEIKTGVKEAPVLDVTIDVPLTAYFPANYVSDERERLALYQYLAGLTDLKKIEEEKANVQHDHGELPTQAKNFFRLLHWKLLAGQAHVLSITTSGVRGGHIEKGLLNLEFVDEPKYARINRVLTEVNPAWQLKDNNLKIAFGTLGKEWPDKLEQTLRVLATEVSGEEKEKKKK
jgi:transcription-repair coupling factor (superfamily II helicase)